MYIEENPYKCAIQNTAGTVKFTLKHGLVIARMVTARIFPHNHLTVSHCVRQCVFCLFILNAKGFLGK